MEEIGKPKVNKDWWDDLSEGQKANIMAGIADVEAGRVMSSEEFWRRVKEADSGYNRNI